MLKIKSAAFGAAEEVGKLSQRLELVKDDIAWLLKSLEQEWVDKEYVKKELQSILSKYETPQ